jgi:sporulation protein YlmC with PRC-barrel domain
LAAAATSKDQDVPDTLLKSSAVHGLHLVGIDGVKLGAVRETFLDLAAGTIGFLVIQVSGLLGGSSKFQPVPWSAVRFDPVASHFVVAVDKATFIASPSYDRDQLANPAYGWQDQAARYFAETLATLA